MPVCHSATALLSLSLLSLSEPSCRSLFLSSLLPLLAKQGKLSLAHALHCSFPLTRAQRHLRRVSLTRSLTDARRVAAACVIQPGFCCNSG